MAVGHCRIGLASLPEGPSTQCLRTLVPKTKPRSPRVQAGAAEGPAGAASASSKFQSILLFEEIRGPLLWESLLQEPCLFGVDVRAPVFWKIPFGDCP